VAAQIADGVLQYGGPVFREERQAVERIVADVVLAGIVTDVRPPQREKVSFPIDVTPEGIVTDVRPVQFENAQLPMEVTSYVDGPYVTEDGIVRLATIMSTGPDTSALPPSVIR
jgi:hypothetical protein